MARRARVGFVGLGRWGRMLADSARSSGQLEIVSCYARTPETRDEFAADYACTAATSVDEMLADPQLDGVVIASTNASHLDLIERAAAAGKGVFVDKPLTNSAADSRAAVAAAQRANVVLQVGYQRRRTPANRAIRAMVDAGELGDLMMLQAHQSAPNAVNMKPGAWRLQPDHNPLGSMGSLGVHAIDTLWYLGGPIARVSSARRPGPAGSIDEAVALLFEFASGAVGTVVSSFYTARVQTVSVHGSRAAAFMEDDGTRLEVQLVGQATRTDVPLETLDVVADQMREFGLALMGEAVAETDGVQGLIVDLVMAAAIESAATGRAVDVEPVDVGARDVS